MGVRVTSYYSYLYFIRNNEKDKADSANDMSVKYCKPDLLVNFLLLPIPDGVAI